MSYESINGHITKDYPDGDYTCQMGPDSPESRVLAEQKLRANGCRSVRFEVHETVLSQTDTELVTANILYAHGYLANMQFNDAVQ